MNTGSFSSKASDSKHYTWTGVLSFLSEHCKTLEMERTQWLVEKKQLTEHISLLSGELQASESSNQDLKCRIKMLEFSLRQERIKYTKLSGNHQRVNSDVVSGILNKEKPEASLPKRRTRAHRQLLSKYLQELGLEDIFSSEVQTRQVHHRPSKSHGNNLCTLIEGTTKSEAAIFKSDSLKVELTEEKHEKKIWDVQVALKSHVDCVRSLYFSKNSKVLLSSGEDCVIKLWDISKYEQLEEALQVEPFFTLRGHKNAIFCMTGNLSADKEVLYTAGQEGVIRAWDLNNSCNADTYGVLPDKGYCLGVWKGHTDCIWDLKHHPVENFLLSTSADGSLKLWKTSLDFNTQQADCIKSYTLSECNTQWTPTVAAWLSAEFNSFVSGCTGPALHVFDRNQSKSTVIKFSKDSVKDKIAQVNCIAADCDAVVVGCEDKVLRFFDMNAGVCVKELVGHTDGVSALWKNGVSVVSGGHDGSLRVWDVRTYGCLQEIPAHRRKYDEGVFCIVQHPSLRVMATGGADCLVKLYRDLQFG